MPRDAPFSGWGCRHTDLEGPGLWVTGSLPEPHLPPGAPALGPSTGEELRDWVSRGLAQTLFILNEEQAGASQPITKPPLMSHNEA